MDIFDVLNATVDMRGVKQILDIGDGYAGLRTLPCTRSCTRELDNFIPVLDALNMAKKMKDRATSYSQAHHALLSHLNKTMEDYTSGDDT